MIFANPLVCISFSFFFKGARTRFDETEHMWSENEDYGQEVLASTKLNRNTLLRFLFVGMLGND